MLLRDATYVDVRQTACQHAESPEQKQRNAGNVDDGLESAQRAELESRLRTVGSKIGLV